MPDKKKKVAPRKALTKAAEPWKDYEAEMLLDTFFKHFPELSDTLLLARSSCTLLSKGHKNSKKDSSIVVRGRV